MSIPSMLDWRFPVELSDAPPKQPESAAQRPTSGYAEDTAASQELRLHCLATAGRHAALAAGRRAARQPPKPFRR